jgi:hypothetical protein
MITMHKQEMTPLGRLKGADYNPRFMPDDEMRRLMRSLTEFGFVDPVVARREDYLIIGGHQRVEAMRRVLTETGLDEESINATLVPSVLLDGVDDAKAKLLNVALNKIHGEWDYTMLSKVFTDLEAMSLPTGTLELSGFTFPEIQDIASLMAMQPPVVEDIDPDEMLAQRARRFSFEVGTNEEAQACNDALRAYGMTSSKNAGDALVAALKAALEHKGGITS